MKVIKWIFISIAILFAGLILCLVIGYYTGIVTFEKGEGGVRSGFAKLSEDKKERVKEILKIDSLTADGNVYQVRHEQVSQYLKGRGKVIVYSYIPYCTGRNCVQPVEIYQKCDSANVELVLISELYYKLFENTADFPQPVLVINAESYNTDNREEYVKMFYNGLVGEGNWNRLAGGLYFCFNKGQYLKQVSKLDDAIDFLKKQ